VFVAVVLMAARTSLRVAYASGIRVTVAPSAWAAVVTPSRLQVVVP
jgi:hypothetical protein